MQCPHCLMHIHLERQVREDSDAVTPGCAVVDFIANHDQRHWWTQICVCPACQHFSVALVSSVGAIIQRGERLPDGATEQNIPIWPRQIGRPPVPLEVPDKFKRDYLEACLILADSPNASAALSRRCLQFILREKLGAQGKTLYDEIRWTIASGGLPSPVAELLDVPRKVGNRAAHPTLSDAGLIVDVEPWEAEWSLEVIEALYDHLFVVPARNSDRLKRLDRVLRDSADG